MTFDFDTLAKVLMGIAVFIVIRRAYVRLIFGHPKSGKADE